MRLDAPLMHTPALAGRETAMNGKTEELAAQSRQGQA
jgi:hypothetical protein